MSPPHAKLKVRREDSISQVHFAKLLDGTEADIVYCDMTLHTSQFLPHLEGSCQSAVPRR